MADIQLRAMTRDEWDQVADLVRVSTNHWYESHGKPAIFTGDPSATRLFCKVYEALDPGCCVVGVCAETGRLAGSCFYRQRETHMALGIMNVHPDYFGRGVARKLLAFITDLADQRGLPLRLVSSAMNLDSFSLYTRAGFVARQAFQDMFVQVPEGGLGLSADRLGHVRPATPGDAAAMADLEMKLVGIRREKDYRFFIENAAGIWHTLVCEHAGGGIDGFLSSVRHPGSHMLGPGVMRDETTAEALIAAQLNHHRGGCPVFLVPCACGDLVQNLYAWGARNCEVHFSQVRGESPPVTGVVMPTFMPETG